MKNIFFIAFIALSITACNNSGTNTTVTTDSLNTATDATTRNTTASVDTINYTPADGDVTYRNGELMVWHGNDWVKADEDVKLDNGIVVYKNGKVKKDDKTITLEDGEVVNRSGSFFDKTGHTISDAWSATKKGVKEAGEAIGHAAKHTKDAIVPDKDDK